MKFDYVIGNPPYQEETAKKETANGQKTQKNVFQHFQEAVDRVTSVSSVLIYPGGRWIQQSGKGMQKFGKAQINDPHLARLYFYSDARRVFKDAEIGDGVSIVVKEFKKYEGGFEYVFNDKGEEITVELKNPGDKILSLNPRDESIAEKLDTFIDKENLTSLHDRILSRSLFGVESDFVEKNPEKVRPLADNNFDPNSEVKLFTNDKAGKSGRATWYITSKDSITQNADQIGRWQVVVSSANAAGKKRDNQLEIIDDHSAFGRSRVALASFDTKQEAVNFYKYVSSFIIRFAFLLTEDNLTSLGKRVPDVLDYTANNHMLNWNENINEQLCKLLGLSDAEFKYVKDSVENIRK